MDAEHCQVFKRRQEARRRRYRPARQRPQLELLEDRIVPTTPSVLSIDRFAPLGPTTNASSVAYAVQFNEAVTGVVPADFEVTTSASLAAATPVAVSGSGSAYTVAIGGIHGSGTLRLDLIANDSIQAGGVPLAPGLGTGSLEGQTYTILQAFPSVLSINRTTPAGPTTNATTVTFTVTFSTAGYRRGCQRFPVGHDRQRCRLPDAGELGQRFGLHRDA